MRLSRDKMIRARERLGYSLELLGEEAGTSKNSALRAEHEEDIRPGTARKIAAALGVEVAELVKESEAPKAPSRSKFFELPGLDAALKHYGMGRNELASRAGMTPGEILDYEIGAKPPSWETVERLAGVLGAAPAELVFPADQAEARRAEEEQENARINAELAELGASDILEERLRNPVQRRIADAYQKAEDKRQADRDRRDETA